ncbi:Protein of unknown function [Bacillus wiedmannii]|uniref:Uncharacterized protein n=1 Tax=Bacillus wiedmannii TaxID=1890302 RepID=A0A1C4DCI6_9BACI|nr:Protein of unknown function [Bacillus wiedmannii]SCL95456.1 Protein of unknown function [Bacillus wiedmannii]
MHKSERKPMVHEYQN